MVTKERRRCACLGVIEAEPDPESIEHAVTVHRATPEHRDYTALEQLRGNYVARQSLQLVTLRLLR